MAHARVAAANGRGTWPPLASRTPEKELQYLQLFPDHAEDVTCTATVSEEQYIRYIKCAGDGPDQIYQTKA